MIALPLPWPAADTWLDRLVKFIVTFPVSLWAGGVQELTVNGGSNYVLTSDTNFTALDKTRKIIVTFTGSFNSTNTSTAAINLGDLSTWTEVEIIVDGSCTVTARGGSGGSGRSASGSGGTAGSAGGFAFDINSANSSANLTVTNNGTISGGGGGGGGGTRASGNTDYNETGGKLSECTANNGVKRGGGGGGGGGRSSSTNASGGSGGSSTGGCSSVTHGSAGGTGTSSSAGGGGARGTGRYNNIVFGGNCGTCFSNVGVAGAGGGGWGSAGSSSSFAGGAGGHSVRNTGSANWTNNGTLNGGTT